MGKHVKITRQGGFNTPQHAVRGIEIIFLNIINKFLYNNI